MSKLGFIYPGSIGDTMGLFVCWAQGSVGDYWELFTETVETIQNYFQKELRSIDSKEEPSKTNRFTAWTPQPGHQDCSQKKG